MPWCHSCEKEYPDGAVKCATCGEFLYEDLPPSYLQPEEGEWTFGKESQTGLPWPGQEDGNPVQAAFLCHVGTGTGMEGELLASLLNGYGIPALSRYPGEGQFGRIILGFSGYGQDLYVPADRLEEAKQLLNHERQG